MAVALTALWAACVSHLIPCNGAKCKQARGYPGGGWEPPGVLVEQGWGGDLVVGGYNYSESELWRPICCERKCGFLRLPTLSAPPAAPLVARAVWGSPACPV